jgi:hypothetical protein
VILGPAYGREPRALMRQARQDEEQGQLAESRIAEGSGDAEAIGDLLQDIE